MQRGTGARKHVDHHNLCNNLGHWWFYGASVGQIALSESQLQTNFLHFSTDSFPPSWDWAHGTWWCLSPMNSWNVQWWWPSSRVNLFDHPVLAFADVLNWIPLNRVWILRSWIFKERICNVSMSQVDVVMYVYHTGWFWKLFTQRAFMFLYGDEWWFLEYIFLRSKRDHMVIIFIALHCNETGVSTLMTIMLIYIVHICLHEFHNVGRWSTCLDAC